MPALSLRGGGALTYDEYGAGPLVVLIHGSPGTARGWQRAAERLAKRFRVVAPNLPGYSGSSASPEPGNAYAAAALGALAKQVGPPRALAGYSYGGVVALQAVLRGEVSPDALALIEPVAVPMLDALGAAKTYARTQAMFDDYASRVEAGDSAAVRTMVEFWFGHGSFEQMPAPARSFLVDQAPGNARDVRATLSDRYSFDALRRLAMPTLVVLGDQSPAVMAMICEGIASGVAHGSLVRLQRANHALITTHADAVADLIADLADRAALEAAAAGSRRQGAGRERAIVSRLDADGLTLSVETQPASQDVEALGEGLTDHALPTVGRPGFQPLAVFARDAGGRLVGGISAHVNWNWLHVSLVWLEESRRRAGLGSRLLAALEAAAIERGCTQAHLDTFSYQARPFYERHGYRVFATLEDYPAGHQRFFMRKALVPPRAPEAAP
jgi:pimeloyl-ACP methyl ester carboxylesterase/ribosomal protein S18 acetylase RimI-like enzyme